MNLTTALETLNLPTPNLPDEKTLSKAYRKASLKHHPDRNLNDQIAAAERFKKIGAAYTFIIQTRDGDQDKEDNEDNDADDDYHRDFDDDEDPDDNRVDGMAWDYEHDLPAWAVGNRKTRDEREQENDDEELELMREQFTGDDSTRESRRFFVRMEKKYATKKKKRDRLAEERRMAILSMQKKDKDDAAFWIRQRRCGSKELSLGGIGCYLHWHPRKLQRQVSKRNLKVKNATTRNIEVPGCDLAWLLLEDDERRYSLGGAERRQLIKDNSSINGSNNNNKTTKKLSQLSSPSSGSSSSSPSSTSSTSSTSLAISSNKREVRNPMGESSLPPQEAARRKIIAGKERYKRGIHPSQLDMLQDANNTTTTQETKMMLQDETPSTIDTAWSYFGSVVNGIGTMLGVTSVQDDNGDNSDNGDNGNTSSNNTAAMSSSMKKARREKLRQQRMEEDLAVKEWREEQRLAKKAKLAITLANKEKQRTRDALNHKANAIRKAKEMAVLKRKQIEKQRKETEQNAIALERTKQKNLWTPELQIKLEEALRKHSSSLPTKERWKLISKTVGSGMTPKKCAARFKFLRNEVKRAQLFANEAEQSKRDELSAMTATERAKMEREIARKKEKDRRKKVSREKAKILLQQKN